MPIVSRISSRFISGFVFISLLTLCFAMLAQPAKAQFQQKRYTQLDILTESKDIKAGETTTLALEQIIAPHWHTYWKNPGDSGAAPAINWQLPDGWSVSDIMWQTPNKIPYGPLLNYGYSNSAILLQNLKAPDDYAGEPVTIKADVEVLVCEDICIPEYDSFEITLNSGAQSSPYDKQAINQSKQDLPEILDTPITYAEETNAKLFTLSITLPEHLQNQDITALHFLPEEWGVLVNADAPTITQEGNLITLTQTRGEQSFDDFDALKGILKITTPDKNYSYEITAQPAPISAANLQKTAAATLSFAALLGAAAFAFIGGLILNLMPCVFPVLSIKALSLVKLADHHPEQARMHGIAYTAGIIVSFLFIAGLMLAIKASGAEIGWGFQLQNPIITASLAYLLFIIGLNLAGVFEIHNPFANIGGKAAQKDGPAGAFFTGILATLVATPCTAPFMATALGVALVQPAPIALLIFSCLGLGLASPFLLLSFIPALQSRMPRPGAWMRILQTCLAFPMFLAAAWLIWVLAQQVEVTALMGVLAGLVFIAMAAWLLQFKNIAAKIIMLFSVLAALGGLYSTTWTPVKMDGEMASPFSHAALDEALATDKPVFVEMTAAWCITCKLNHAAAINISSTKKLFKDQDITYFIGDWTNKEPEITRYLEEFNRAGVPLYIYYPAPNTSGKRPDPITLPQLLTPSIVKDTILENAMH